jgi:feruloyl-CoA synthase
MADNNKYNNVLAGRDQAPFIELETIPISIDKEMRPDGSVLVRSTIPLEPGPVKLTERLEHWAKVSPDKVFLGQRPVDQSGSDVWKTITYRETLKKVRSLGQALLNRSVSKERPIIILSENSIEHGLMALAALYAGIPYSPVSPAYSLRSDNFDKLTHIFRLLSPGLIFVQDAKKYERALRAVADGIEVVSLARPEGDFNYTSFHDLLKVAPSFPLKGATGFAVDEAHNSIKGDNVAKILFTSGSTGLPKGVINTHENLTSNLQQITQTFPFLKDANLELVDWLPWNHTFGGNHNFGITLYNGGSLYIDDGNPTPEGIMKTVNNLRDRKPTIYFNVPKGFESLIPFLKKDNRLRTQFFSNLKMLFYAGAGMAQHLWDALEELSVETIGKKILIGTGLGCTESCPSALFASQPGGYAGLLGVPVPGLELKLVPREDKLEARYRGKNIFPGYWRQPELTAAVFDEEGFYCTGDALKFVDESHVEKGMIFNGRLAEDFKLNTGTWVNVGILKAKLIAEGNGLIQDAVLTGHDNDFVGAIILPEMNYCKNKFALREDVALKEIATHPQILYALMTVLNRLAERSSGSSTLIKRALIADFVLSIDRGEVTDKASVNQAMVLKNHPELVEKIYSDTPPAWIVEVRSTFKEGTH